MSLLDGEIPLLNGEIYLFNGKMSLSDGEIPLFNGKMSLLDGEIPLLDGKTLLSHCKILFWNSTEFYKKTFWLNSSL